MLCSGYAAFWAWARHRAKPIIPQPARFPWRQEASGPQGGEGRNQEGMGGRRAGSMWEPGRENTLHPGLLALQVGGKSGQLGAEAP